jgi:hypothetical protein
MREYRVNSIKHIVYDNEDEFPESLHVVDDWRVADVGQWVRTDDDCYIQILRKGKMHTTMGRNKVRYYVGTCTGTFPTSKTSKMDTSRRPNIYSFGGNKNSDDILIDRKKLSGIESLFVLNLAKGMSPKNAYLMAYPTKNERYAHQKSIQLVKTERVMTAMKEELKPVLKELGVNEEYYIRNMRDMVELGQSESNRLKALIELGDVLDIKDKNQTKFTQISGAVFKGFSEDLLEEVKRPKEIKNGKK